MRAAGQLDPAARKKPTGQPLTPLDVKRFYDRIGWKTDQGRAVDSLLFSFKEDGPLRQQLNAIHRSRMELAIRRAGEPLKLLECGCGGNPARNLLSFCSAYYGTDFSETGLALAADMLQGTNIPCTLKFADIRSLPFADREFDAVYCAHVIYHIPNRDDQRRALREMLRVLRPGGVLVLVTANPRPLLFPMRLMRRLIAEMPGLSRMASWVGRRALLPYRPPSLGWLKRLLAPDGSVEVISLGLPSTYFVRQVSEFSGAGRLLWRLIRYLDLRFPRASAYLGNYAQVTVLKSV